MGSPEEREKAPDDVPSQAEAHAAAEPSRAVFLSYASQDAEAARKICHAMRGAGIEVWFDQSELRGGDAWDHSIRKQIKTCALFIPVISRHTHDRDEGYFRLEWSLAVDRCRLMAADKAFLLPVVVDDTRDDDERVPERFREVQWTRLPGGETLPAFVERVRRLLAPQPSTAGRPAMGAVQSAPAVGEPVRTPWRSKAAIGAIVAVLAALSVFLLVEKRWVSKHQAPPPVTHKPPSVAPPATAASFAPPPHSIAVLPFVNMSGDKQQDYFSDGLSEELLNDLARINELQVAARTSAFSFKGKDTDIGTIGRKLNVGSVLEGSVRRSGRKIRITAQLNNAVTGFHIWSETYDRDLGDVLQLQTEIATAVAGALKVALLGDAAAKIELGGTSNPAAFDAYLRGLQAQRAGRGANDVQAAISAFTEAIRIDPTYALAYANRSTSFNEYAGFFAASPTAAYDALDKARSDANQAIALAPDLSEGHYALASYLHIGAFDFARAAAEYERARTLAPGNARVLRGSSIFMAYMGRGDAAMEGARRTVALDPLNWRSHYSLGYVLQVERRMDESFAPFNEAIALNPDAPISYAQRGWSYYHVGDFHNAQLSCEAKPDYTESQVCLAATYKKLGRDVEAESAFAKVKKAWGDDTVQTAEIYAQWGDTPKALESLERAAQLRDTGLSGLKTDPLMDPLRNEPRFQAIERELKFPE